MDETKPTRFEFIIEVEPNKHFVIELREPEKIEHARRIIRGEETKMVHIQGTIVKQNVSYNPDWSYYLKPESIEFFESSIEVCDSTMQDVEDKLDKVLDENYYNTVSFFFVPDVH